MPIPMSHQEVMAIKKLAQAMTLKELKWQIDNARAVNVTGAALQLFKKEYDKKKAAGLAGGVRS